MKKSKAPNIVTISILTLVTILLWIMLGISNLLGKPPRVSVKNETIEPLTPTLDIDTLNSIESRLFYTEGEIGEIIFTQESSESEEEIESEEEVSEQTEATESAELGQ